MRRETDSFVAFDRHEMEIRQVGMLEPTAWSNPALDNQIPEHVHRQQGVVVNKLGIAGPHRIAGQLRLFPRFPGFNLGDAGQKIVEVAYAVFSSLGAIEDGEHDFSDLFFSHRFVSRSREQRLIVDYAIIQIERDF